MNATPVSGSPAILGLIDFKHENAGAFTTYHLIVSDNGRLDRLKSDNTVEAADALNATPFTAGTHRPDWVTAKNFLYIVNGEDKKKFDGTTVWGFGIEAPEAAPSLSEGSAGTPNGSYEVALFYYNSATGFYSSLGPADSITVSSKQIDVTWDDPDDPQITHVGVAIRNTSNQNQFYEVELVSIGAETYTIDVDTTLLRTVAPDTQENNPPPDGLIAIEFHNERLFVTDGDELYYSKRKFLEAFHPEAREEGQKKDGQKLVALHAAHGVLMIFKTNSTYLLIGDDPADWRIELLDPAIGATSPRSIFTVEGVTYWWSEQGPMAWTGSGPVVPIGAPKIGPTISTENLNHAAFAGVSAAPDYQRSLMLFAVPEAGQTRNTIILPYNYRIGAWVSDRHDPMDASVLGVVQEASAEAPKAFLGGYKGQVFQFDTGVGNDGLPAGSTKEGTVTGATSSTLSDANASFTTTGGKLIERYVWVEDPAGTKVQRRRITDNTGTELTITPNWSTTPVAGWTYTIAGPDFQLDTRWNFADAIFLKKRFQFLTLLGASQNSGVSVTVELFLDMASTVASKVITAILTAGGAKWNQAKWNQAKWGGARSSIPNRKRVGKTGFAWRARIMNRKPDEDVEIYQVGMESELLSSKMS